MPLVRPPLSPSPNSVHRDHRATPRFGELCSDEKSPGAMRPFSRPRATPSPPRRILTPSSACSAATVSPGYASPFLASAPLPPAMHRPAMASPRSLPWPCRPRHARSLPPRPSHGRLSPRPRGPVARPAQLATFPTKSPGLNVVSGD
ncbi:hypothetical protein ZWY2020_007211 [Hordeum vulgare]|nr:hypothetical protein ZWY2020_007211 [Hordeum vulgare]